jgi:hypothetical protein
MTKSFEVKIVESSMELTHKQKVALKDISRAIKLDDACSAGNELQIKPTGYAILSVHNDKADNPDYEQYLIIDSSGEKYVTGSESFWRSFIDIWTEMTEDVEESEEWDLIIYKKDSKNYKGKQFLTCSIV